MAPDIIAEIDRLKAELDACRPLSAEAVGRVAQKLRIEWNYHSNAIEGNALTLGETRSLILYGLTARGKSLRDHLDIEGHDDAVKAIEEAVAEGGALNQAFVRNLHKILLKEPYEVPAEAPDGRRDMRTIAVGEYKKDPNNVRTQTGEVHYFAPPEQVQPMMSDLLDWQRAKEDEGEHPIVIAATLHYRFVQIHPFDDGNGRMARLLTNLILTRHGYTVAIVQRDGRDRYIAEIEQAQATGNLAGFIRYIAECCRYSLELHLRAARGESIEDPGDIDREIAVFKRSMAAPSGEGGPIQARLLAVDTVLPLYEYLRDKTESLASFFVETETFGTLSFLESNGATTDVGLPFAGEISDLPQDATFLRMNACAFFRGFRATRRDMSLSIERTGDGAWRFKLDSDDSEAQQRIATVHVGDDLGELKECANGVIRKLMAVLREWGKQPGNPTRSRSG